VPRPAHHLHHPLRAHNPRPGLPHAPDACLRKAHRARIARPPPVDLAPALALPERDLERGVDEVALERVERRRRRIRVAHVERHPYRGRDHVRRARLERQYTLVPVRAVRRERRARKMG
jgi:hypothetical protein